MMRTFDAPTVLVVEDEGVVAIHLRECLSDLGLNAHVFTEGQPALDAVACTTYSAAVLDLGLPDISGDRIVVALLERDPKCRILVTTGQDLHDVQRRFADAARVRVLCKPYDGAMLEEELAKLGVITQAPVPVVHLLEGFASVLTNPQWDTSQAPSMSVA